ncbi:MAG TPA: GNAT family N-acetyltransferase [Rhodospirillaceae bacterium]|nr:GNAT family N-acetyltransferase [Rhodospirillaceae bacterium]
MIAIRAARPEDSAEILRLLRLLAAYEGNPGAVTTDEQAIRRDGFGAGRRFETLLAERAGHVRGLAVLFDAYSSWRGAPTLVIHDLFVEEAARGLGAGRALVAAAARLAAERGCCRIDLNVVEGNDGGRRFYEGLGFKAVAGWLPYRLSREDLERQVTLPR